ncbi:non-ribosomal peptide synthetase [Methylococcus mesophilus]|uniref:non-ribosomal peptide synthetase n=1 Tax=Methylococcus mesophilus TaxID=2993564 RepID=UPI00224AA593|nr:amino acid adenylation domain-containing protein [Methylococcus mesophilus]UZR29993.1 amino acid adenylation domain-containing protein [Methylococcus mesophilus]
MTDCYALSPMQGNMLSATLFDQREGTYIQQLVLRTSENLDEAAYREAWTRLVARHDILRTAFVWRNLEAPLQRVEPAVTMPWADFDWRGLARAEQESRFDAFLAEDRLHGFDMAEAPLHRLSLIRIAGDEHWAVWTYHHALLDGRARLIIMEELFLIYQALRDDHEPELPPATPYRGYIDWLDSVDFAASEDYWRGLLADSEEPNRVLSALPEPRPLSPAHTGGLVQAWAPPALYEALQELAKKQDVTLNTLVQAAWALLIARHSGLDDVVFGATRSCRKSVPAGEAIVGPIINTTPVRLKADPAKSVAEFIRELRRQHLSVRDHEHTPTARIHAWSGLPAGMPLFTTIVVFENYHVVKSRGGDWDKRRFELKEQTDHLILAGYLADGLLLKIEFDRRLFEDDTVERMLQQLLTILESLAACADGKLADLRSLPDGELHRLLVEWNDTGTRYPEVTLGELFSAQARRTPDAIAVQSGNQRLSYGELERRSNRLAALLLSKGAGPGSVVALLLDRSCELAVGLLGVLKAGGAYLPLDPAYPEDRLAYMLEDSGARIVLTRTALADALRHPGVELLRLDTGWESDPAGSDEAPPCCAKPDHLAYLMYTSGSTGLPKGVMVPHRGVVNLCGAMQRRYGLGPHDRVLQYASISFDICVEEIYPTWHAGGTVVFRDETQGHSVHEFLDWAAHEGITVFNLPTAFWNELVRGLGTSGAGLPDSLRLTVVGGEKASRAMLEAWNRLPGAARVAWLNTYGPTETTVTATVYQPPQFSPAGPPATDPPIGRPIDNVRLYVLDRHLQPAPIGVPGELYIGGAGVAKGYRRRPELTAAAFVPDPFAGAPEARMYRTGDLVRYGADGQLSFVGRNDNQVKISGFRVEPGAIEAAIERYDGVAQAAVKAVEAPGGKYLAAYVVPAPGGRFDAKDLETFLRDTLPEHKIPRVFLALAEFPLTPGGKLDRKALPDPAAPSPSAGGAEVPRSGSERKLAAIFEELFPARSIGLRDNFFAIGGDSLRAFQLLTRIELACGQRLSFAALARAATVEQLAALIDGGGDAETPNTHIVPLSLEAAQGPALFLVHGVGGSVHWYHALAESLKADFNLYGIQSPGMDEGEDALIGADVESLARLYISEIKAVQAQGPYWIGGHSMGGIIAFEMARQFHALGDEVALVANFDNWNRAADAPGFGTKLLRLAVHFVKLGTADKLRFLRDKMQWAKQCLSARLAPGRADARPLEEMKAANVKAAYRYLPGFYPGTLTLFRARQQAATALDDPLLGWNGLAEEIDVVEVPGNHYTLLGEPHVRTLADELRRRARPLGSSGR